MLCDNALIDQQPLEDTNMTLTKVQKVVVDAKMKDGYTVIGLFQNLSGLAGADVGLVKGKHRIHINCLGYDSYVSGLVYQEIK